MLLRRFGFRQQVKAGVRRRFTRTVAFPYFLYQHVKWCSNDSRMGARQLGEICQYLDDFDHWRGRWYEEGSPMTFEELLAHVIEVLQREGRISYRALQRRFDLDDAYLDDVKVELIEAKQLARDENGRILVWAAQATTTASPPIAQE